MKQCCICLDAMEVTESITNVCENHYIHKRCFIKYIMFHCGGQSRLCCPLCRDEIVYETIIKTITKLRKDVRGHVRHLKYEIYRQKLEIMILKSKLSFCSISKSKKTKSSYRKMYEQNLRSMQHLDLHYLETQELALETERLWNYLNPSLFNI
jgi:hypothetical protein